MAADFRALAAQLFRGEKGEPEAVVDRGREGHGGPGHRGRGRNGVGGLEARLGQERHGQPWAPTLYHAQTSASPSTPEPADWPLSGGIRISWKKGQREPSGRPPPGLNPH